MSVLVWRLGFESPRTGYCFNKFLYLGLRSLRTLFLKFVAVLRHTLVLCYIAPIPFRITSMIFRSVALPLEILISHFVSALTLDLLQISRERFFCNDPSISCHPPRNLRLSNLFPVILVLISLTPVPLPGSHRQDSPYLQCVHPSTAGCPLQSPLPLSEINNLTLISVNKLWPTFRQCCLLQHSRRLNTF